MNLAIRDIRHSSGRFVLTCLGLGLLLGVVLSMVGIYRGLIDDALVLVRTPSADLWVVEDGSRGPFAEASRLPTDVRDIVARLPGVTASGAVTYQSIELAAGSRTLRALVVGYEIGRLGGPSGIAKGRDLMRAHFEMVADERSGLRLGDRIPLARDSYTVVGLTRGQVDSGGNPVLYVTLKDAQNIQFALQGAAARSQALRGATSDRNTVNAVIARLASGVSADEMAESVRHWKHFGALTQGDQEAMLLTSVVEKARKQIGLFTAILLIVSAVIISLIIYTMTMDKAREIATLKLIGAPNRTIIGLILQEAVSMGFLGFLFGAAIIASVGDRFPRRVILEATDAFALAGVVLLVCVVASALGVRFALRVDPAKALAG
jgi:putative ABC transport system permease protein